MKGLNQPSPRVLFNNKSAKRLNSPIVVALFLMSAAAIPSYALSATTDIAPVNEERQTQSSSPVLFTGEVSSSEQQLVSAPMTDRWQVQIQWMAEEGTLAQKGDLVVLFDAGSIKTQIQQNEEQLATQKLLLEQRKVELKQNVVEAQGRLDIALLEVDKARIEAEIESGDVSDYDKGRYKLSLERALVEKIKAQENLRVQQKEQEVGLAKQTIEITKIEESLLQLNKTLERTTVKARVNGQVSYMMHPWQRTKITAGMTVQQSMKVMLVQGKGEYLVRAWLHEIDVNKVNVGERATVSLDAYLGKRYEAKIVNIASQSEPKPEWGTSNYHEVQLKFSTQPEVKLLPGMSARVVVLPSQQSQLSQEAQYD